MRIFISSLVTLIFIFLSQFLPRAFTSINIIIALNAFARIHATLNFHVLDNSFFTCTAKSKAAVRDSQNKAEDE